MYDICMNIYIYVWLYVCIYLYVYIYVYIYVCNYVYIYIYCYVSIYKYIKVQRIYATYIRIYDRCIAIYIHINTLKKTKMLIYYANYV